MYRKKKLNCANDFSSTYNVFIQITHCHWLELYCISATLRNKWIYVVSNTLLQSLFIRNTILSRDCTFLFFYSIAHALSSIPYKYHAFEHARAYLNIHTFTYIYIYFHSIYHSLFTMCKYNDENGIDSQLNE